MLNQKPAVKSLGFWGSITGIVGFVGVLPDLISLFQTLEPAIREIINQGTVLIGLIMALIGRLKATKEISGIFK